MSKGKWDKVLTESWVNNHRDLTEEEAKNELITAQIAIKTINHEKDQDEQLQAAKEIAKDLNKGYSSAVKYEKAKIDFLIEQIENIRIAKKAQQ